jgi:sugar/nucleoside kinase (ribokinase family)
MIKLFPNTSFENDDTSIELFKGIKLVDKIDQIKDTTGAGDAFWTGFLYAQIQNKSLQDCITLAQKLAGIKLQNVGRLPENINIKEIIEV